MKDTIVILNPAARGARTQRLRTQVEKLARGAIVCATSGAGEAERLARNAAVEGYEKIVAAGGDGTVNEIVNGIAGHNVTLGLLPIGTMNVFATELGLPLNDLAGCWKIIEQNRTHRVDLPRANGQHFVQLAGVGVGSTGRDGIRHLPSAFWAQRTSGFTNEMSLMTRCPPKSDEKRIRSRKVFAVRKSGDTPG